VVTVLAVLLTVRGADRAVPADMAMRERDLKETISNTVGKFVKLKEISIEWRYLLSKKRKLKECCAPKENECRITTGGIEEEKERLVGCRVTWRTWRYI
jgi:hypothetical protein